MCDTGRHLQCTLRGGRGLVGGVVGTFIWIFAFWLSAYSNSHSLMYLLLLHRSHLDTETTETSCCCHREELVKTWELSAGAKDHLNTPPITTS